MVDAGVKDILIAYPIVGLHKAEELVKLAERPGSQSLWTQKRQHIYSSNCAVASVTVGVLIELDVGFSRCGLSDERDALRLPQKICELPGLEFRGLMFYPGHLLAETQRQLELLHGINLQLDRTFEVFVRAHLPVPIVSGGSTPAYISHLFHGVNEIRPGMYLFNDRTLMISELFPY